MAEVKLKAGWLEKDLRRASERINEWEVARILHEQRREGSQSGIYTTDSTQRKEAAVLKK